MKTIKHILYNNEYDENIIEKLYTHRKRKQNTPIHKVKKQNGPRLRIMVGKQEKLQNCLEKIQYKINLDCNHKQTNIINVEFTS
jgi:hypothetical protein